MMQGEEVYWVGYGVATLACFPLEVYSSCIVGAYAPCEKIHVPSHFGL